MSATVKTLRPESKKAARGPGFPLEHRTGSELFEHENRDGGMSYFVLVDFSSLGPRFYGPFKDEATAKKYQVHATEILIEHEQECDAALSNVW